ncbi:36720_t:CDS:2, partial [Racocetra persica]
DESLIEAIELFHLLSGIQFIDKILKPDAIADDIKVEEVWKQALKACWKQSIPVFKEGEEFLKQLFYSDKLNTNEFLKLINKFQKYEKQSLSIEKIKKVWKKYIEENLNPDLQGIESFNKNLPDNESLNEDEMFSLLNILSQKERERKKAAIGSKEMISVLGTILKSSLNEGSFTSTEQLKKSIQQKLLYDKTLKQNQKEYLFDYLQKIEDEVNAHEHSGEKRQCEICKNLTHAKWYCEHCIRNYLQQHFKDWTSGNAIVDKIIQNCQLQTQQPHRVIEWIPFDSFKCVQRLTENSIHTAFWNNGSFANWNIEKQLLERHGGHPVVLKRLKDFNNYNSGSIQTIKSHFLIDNTRQYLVQCFGITMNPETLNFMLVMEKMDTDLRSFLRDNNHIVTWEQRLKYVEIISFSLNVIHKAGYLHRDLHPDHILIQLFNNRVIKMKI